MPAYLVETYLARNQPAERSARERRARSAAHQLAEQGLHVRFRRSIHLPEDELCFYLFEAPTRRTAALVAETAGLTPLRVVEAITSRADTTPEEKT